MKVELLHHTPLWIAAHAIRTCHNSFDKSDTKIEFLEGFFDSYQMDQYTGQKDKELIHRVGNKLKHASTLEHLNYTFYIKGISRAVLQELARHRIGVALSVKSTRYTLKELRNEEPFVKQSAKIIANNDEFKKYNIETEADDERAGKYIVLTGNEDVDFFSIIALDNLRELLVQNISNDIAKYALPECYKTELTYTINARSLQNFLTLRSNKAALWEIRDLAKAIFNALPDDHKYLFKHCIKDE